jgi:hypothetical protein
MAALHDAACRDRESAVARIAVKQTGAMTLAVQAVDLRSLTAVRAERAIDPVQLFEVLAGFIFIVENGVCQVDIGHGITSFLR